MILRFNYKYKMKKLITRKERERKNKINQLIIGLVLIGLMIFSTLGFAFSGRINEESALGKINYNGVDFIGQDGSWSFNIQGYDFRTKYSPDNVSNINFFNILTVQDYVEKPLYLVGEAGEHMYEIEVNLLDKFVLRTSFACLDEEECEGDFPIKNCSEDNVIIFEEVDYDEGYVESIEQNENCIFITTSLANQTRYVDAFLFDLLGIK